jgi:hypothetical protein
MSDAFFRYFYLDRKHGRPQNVLVLPGIFRRHTLATQVLKPSFTGYTSIEGEIQEQTAVRSHRGNA